MLKKLKSHLEVKKEKKFWNSPDSWLSVVILDGGQVYARIKNNLALLERIPKPETGYFYKDIVYVKGPIGKQLFRDEEIDEYQVTGIYKKSNCPTFTFKAILPNSKDYFHLMDEFKGERLKVEIPWSDKDNNLAWRKGHCTAENIEIAKELLKNFVRQGKGRQVKEIKIWNE